MNISTTRIKPLAVFIPLTYFAIIISWQYHLPSISTDGHTYLQIARNIHYGAGLGWQALWAPPLYSILTALVAWIPGVRDLQAAAGIVSILSGALLAVALYSLGTQLFGRKAGLVASVLALSHPYIIDTIFITEPEITYASLLTLSLTLLVASIRRDSFRLAILTGIAFSLAYLSRSEGFLIMGITVGSICATQGIRFYHGRLFKLSILVVLAFFIAASPYLLFLKKHYGAFVISPKATYVLIWMKGAVYHDHDKEEIKNDDLWGLTPEGRLKWQQPSGISDLAKYLLENPSRNVSVYLENLLNELPWRLPNPKHYPYLYPLPALILAAAAIFFRWGEDSKVMKALLFSPFIILLIFPLVTGGWPKYLLPYTPLLFVAASGGLFLTFGKFVAQGAHSRSGALVRFIPVCITCALVIRFLSVYFQQHQVEENAHTFEKVKGKEYMMNAAKAAREHYGPGKNYMVSWNKMIYYLDGLWTPLPIAPDDAIARYAAVHRVDYIIRLFSPMFNPVDQVAADMPPGVLLDWIYLSDDNILGAVFYRLPDHR